MIHSEHIDDNSIRLCRIYGDKLEKVYGTNYIENLQVGHKKYRESRSREGDMPPIEMRSRVHSRTFATPNLMHALCVSSQGHVTARKNIQGRDKCVSGLGTDCYRHIL